MVCFRLFNLLQNYYQKHFQYNTRSTVFDTTHQYGYDQWGNRNPDGLQLPIDK